MRKLLFALLLIAFPAVATFAQPQKERPEEIVTFHFVSGQDAFYIPWSGNDAELNRLYALTDKYKGEITAGRMPVYVDGYSASMKDTKRNLQLAFVRANRVKSELITNKGLLEEHFVTKNHTVAYIDADGKSHKDMVVVTIRIPAKEEPKQEVRPEPKHEEPKYKEQPAVVEPTPEPVSEPEEPVVSPVDFSYSRWSIGASVGMPFFWGDMNSLAYDKTYLGVSVGLQVTCQVSQLLGVGLSFEWAQNKAGSRDYATGYLLDASGMTWYTPQSITTQAYGDLYSKIDMYSAGLHLDVNILHLFGPRMANGRFKVIVSPAVYAQHFSSKVYTKADDKVFADNSLSKDLSLGLGGNLALRYAVSPVIDLQLKGTGIWITDNCFENIKTIGYVKQNAMWGVSAGAVWKIGGSHKRNLLYKKK